MSVWDSVISAGGGLIGGTIQAIGAHKASSLQYDRQKLLMDKAQEQNKSMALFNKGLQMQMWKDTGPQGQMEQLKLAGLNPGLIYGMGGAGGQTAQAAQGGAQSTPSAGAPINTMAGMGIMGLQMAEQLQLLKAQKDKTIAEKDAIIANTPGPGQIQAKLAGEINNLDQDLKNKNAELIFTQAKTKFQEIQNIIADATFENAITIVAEEATQTHYDTIRAIRNNWIEEEQAQTKVDLLKAEYTKLLVDKALNEQLTQESKAGTQLKTQMTEQSKAEVTNMIVQRLQEARKIEIAGGHLDLEKFLHDTPDSTGIIGNLVSKLVGIVAALGLLKGFKGRQGIGFKPQKY